MDLLYENKSTYSYPDNEGKNNFTTSKCIWWLHNKKDSYKSI